MQAFSVTHEPASCLSDNLHGCKAPSARLHRLVQTLHSASFCHFLHHGHQQPSHFAKVHFEGEKKSFQSCSQVLPKHEIDDKYVAKLSKTARKVYRNREKYGEFAAQHDRRHPICIWQGPPCGVEQALTHSCVWCHATPPSTHDVFFSYASTVWNPSEAAPLTCSRECACLPCRGVDRAALRCAVVRCGRRTACTIFRLVVFLVQAPRQ